MLLLTPLLGCSHVTTLDVPLRPQADKCQIVEARPSTLSTVGLAVCWDSKARPIGMVGGHGTGEAEAAAGILTSAAIVGGSALIGQGLSGIKVDPQIRH